MRPPDDELEAVVDETSPAERKRRRRPFLVAVVVLAVTVASVALLSRREDPAPDLTCNERDLFDPENANLFVRLAPGSDPRPTLNSLRARSHDVEEMMGKKGPVVHVRFTPSATSADVDTFVENARLLPDVTGVDVGPCALR